MKIFLRLLAGLALPASLVAIEAPLDDLQTPASPAFALVGVSPTKIERPGSPAAFGASLVNAATESTGGLPANLAFEFTPYWWKDRPAITLKSYNEAEPLDVVMQSMTFSLATFEKDKTDTVDKYSGIGAGVRFDIIRGQPNQELHNKLMARKREITRSDPNGTVTEEQNAELKKMALNYDSSRVGPQLSFAAAVSYRFVGADKDRELDRYGAWLTFAYKPAKKHPLLTENVTCLAVARAIGEKGIGTAVDKNYFDYGASLVWRDPEHPVIVSLEYLKRTGDAHDETVTGLLQYRAGESWYLFLSHGHQLEGDGNKDKKLTTAGITLSWGKKPKFDVQ